MSTPHFLVRTAALGRAGPAVQRVAVTASISLELGVDMHGDRAWSRGAVVARRGWSRAGGGRNDPIGGSTRTGAMVWSGPPDPRPGDPATSSDFRLPFLRTTAGGERKASDATASRNRSAAAKWLPTFVLGLIGVAFATAFFVSRVAPVDTLHYFQTGQMDHFYGTVWGSGEGAEAWYVYPPPFAYIVRAMSIGGWGEWIVVWTVLLAVSFSVIRWVGVAVVLIGFGARLFVDNFRPISEPANHLTIGNLQPLILATVVLGLRYPAMWAIPLLTKIGPGIGILWFVARRDWRSLGIALGVTGAIAGVSFVIDPGSWGDWVRFMLANVSTPSPVPVVPIPAWVRFPIAIVLIVWGARTDRPWTVPIACGIASFALYEWSYLTIWLGVFAFVGPWAPRDPDGRPSLAGPRLKSRSSEARLPQEPTPPATPATA